MGVKAKPKKKAKKLPRMEQLRRMVKGRRETMKTASFREAERELLEKITDPYEMNKVKKTIQDLIEKKQRKKERLTDIPDVMFVSGEIKYLRTLLRGQEWLDMLKKRKENKTRLEVKAFMKTPQFQQWVEGEVMDSIREVIGDIPVIEELKYARKDLNNEAKNLIIENLLDPNNPVELEARLQFLDDLTSSQARFERFLRKKRIIG